MIFPIFFWTIWYHSSSCPNMPCAFHCSMRSAKLTSLISLLGFGLEGALSWSTADLIMDMTSASDWLTKLTKSVTKNVISSSFVVQKIAFCCDSWRVISGVGIFGSFKLGRVGFVSLINNCFRIPMDLCLYYGLGFSVAYGNLAMLIRSCDCESLISELCISLAFFSLLHLTHRHLPWHVATLWSNLWHL